MATKVLPGLLILVCIVSIDRDNSLTRVPKTVEFIISMYIEISFLPSVGFLILEFLFDECALDTKIHAIFPEIFPETQTSSKPKYLSIYFSEGLNKISIHEK